MNRMVSRLCACLVAFSLFAALCGGMVARAADGVDYNYTLGWKRPCAPRAG